MITRAAWGLNGSSVDGRWHTAGRHLDYYAAQRLSLALERLARYKRLDALEAHLVYVLDVPDTAIERAPAPPRGWDGDETMRHACHERSAYCRVTTPRTTREFLT